MFNQVDNSGRVTVFVVVPGDQLDELWRQLDTGGSVEDGRSGVTQEVRGDNSVFSVTQDTLQLTFSGSLDNLLDFIVGGFLVQLDSQVNNGNIDGWDSESHTGQLTLQFWQDLTDSLSSTGRGWDDVTGSGSTTSPVLVGWTVDGLLGSGQGVDSGHQTFFDTESFVNNLGQWSQTVSGTGSVGDNLQVRSVLVFVNTNNEHWGGGRWSSDDNLLGTSVNVLLSGVQFLENTSGVNGDVNVGRTPWQVSWVSFLVSSNLLTIDNDVLVIVGNFTGVSTVSGVVLEHVSSIIVRDKWVVQSNNFDVWSRQSNSHDQSTDSTETVNSNSNHFVCLCVFIRN